MLSVRRELEKTEEEIEHTEGEMKYINFHSKYSDVYIALNENVLFPSQYKFSNILKETWQKALFGLIYSLMWLIIVLAWVIPYIIIVYIVYIIWRRKHENV